MLRTILFLLIFVVGGLHSQTRSDYILIEHPDKLLLLNKYQQEISQHELNSFKPFTPFLIIEKHTFFADGIRSYLKVALEGEEFYMLTNNDGKIRNAEFVGINKKFTRRKVAGDTIKVIAEKKVRVRMPGTQSYSYLYPGDKVVRIFRDVSEYYGYNLAGDYYCWVKMSPPGKYSGWEKYVETFEKYRMPRVELESKLIDKIEQYNELMKNLEAHFNTRFSKDKSFPKWNIEISYDTISISVTGEHDGFGNTVDEMKKELLELIEISAYRYKEAGRSIKIFN